MLKRTVKLLSVLCVLTAALSGCDDSNGDDGMLVAPRGLTATAVSSRSVTLSWSAVPGATKYFIYRSTSGSSVYYPQVGSSTSTPYTDAGLSADTTYYYKVSASNSGGEGYRSNYISAKTSVLAVPTVPADVTAAAASSSSVTVRWSAVSGADGYYIYRSTSSSGTYSQVGSPTSTSYTDVELPANATYYYKVSAFNGDGTGAQSSPVSATTSTVAPTGITAAAASSSSITVSWAAVSGADEYSIYRSTSSSGAYTYIGFSSSTSYTDAELSANTMYYYQVSAYNGSAESARSSSVSAATLTP
ncbi:MAG: fibronectin type III domain-containing protein [Treponema sp.]|jgi:fibronectin type 3 domain-containing protein|nr:fibronectin type III domain-containing protein [Treponema sp.]